MHVLLLTSPPPFFPFLLLTPRYVREGIQWQPIDFFNNKIVCDLIEGKRPAGIFMILNDSCATAHADPEAADRKFCQSLGMQASNPHLNSSGSGFIIKHYAGDVAYSAQGFTDRNKDSIPGDLLVLVKVSLFFVCVRW